MREDFNKPQVLECPACGATLALPDSDTFACDYCGKTILVPPSLRQFTTSSQPAAISTSADPTNVAWYESLQSTDESTSAKPQHSKLILTISTSLAVLIIGVVAFLLIYIPTNSSLSSKEPPINPLKQTPVPTELPFAQLDLVFGSKGTEPGQFDGARSIAVDPDGNIFVADYTSGRINKFDTQGKFLQLIQIPSLDGNIDIYCFSIATDALGNLYVTAGGNIFKFSTSTGEILLTIPDQWPQIYFEKVTIAPDGNLYATNGMAGSDEVIILSPQGEILAHWIDVIKNANHDDAAIDLAMGVSHAGITYILSPFGNQVYGYNPDGYFKFSFGEKGDNPGQFSLSTGMLAITDQDYLVISDVYRVDLFDAEGNYLGKTFTIDYQVAGGSVFGMTIDSHGNLYYISSGGKVLKYVMNYPGKND